MYIRHPVEVVAIRCILDASFDVIGSMAMIDMSIVRRSDIAFGMWDMSRRVAPKGLVMTCVSVLLDDIWKTRIVDREDRL